MLKLYKLLESKIPTLHSQQLISEDAAISRKVVCWWQFLQSTCSGGLAKCGIQCTYIVNN